IVAGLVGGTPASAQAPAPCFGNAGFVGLSSVTTFLSILNTIDTAFLTQTNAFVVSQSPARPNETGGGVWARAVGGQVTIDGSATVTLPGGAQSPCSSRSRLDYAGFQIGADIAKFNLDRSGAN